MIITVQYSDDDMWDFRQHQNANIYSNAITDVYDYCRQKMKYDEGVSEEVYNVCEEIRLLVYEAWEKSMEQ